jgi:hypothetical protein
VETRGEKDERRQEEVACWVEDQGRPTQLKGWTVLHGPSCGVLLVPWPMQKRRKKLLLYSVSVHQCSMQK